MSKTRARGDFHASPLLAHRSRPTAWAAADITRFEDGKLTEHHDVLQDEATKAQSLSGLPMFGDRLPN
jgi:predicted SnoaL-like aldol condensation-catalyzing enzyme